MNSYLRRTYPLKTGAAIRAFLRTAAALMGVVILQAIIGAESYDPHLYDTNENFLMNPGFEEGATEPASWLISAGANWSFDSDTPSGNGRSIRFLFGNQDTATLTSNYNNSSEYYYVRVIPGYEYEMKMDLKISVQNDDHYLRIRTGWDEFNLFDGSSEKLQNNNKQELWDSPGTQWTQIVRRKRISLKGTSTVDHMRVAPIFEGKNITYWVDDLSFCAKPLTVVIDPMTVEPNKPMSVKIRLFPGQQFQQTTEPRSRRVDISAINPSEYRVAVSLINVDTSLSVFSETIESPILQQDNQRSYSLSQPGKYNLQVELIRKADGFVKDSVTNRVLCVSRPTNMGTDGIYRDKGEEFFPFGVWRTYYHNRDPAIAKLGDNGVLKLLHDQGFNTVLDSPWNQSYFDTAESLGMKILVCHSGTLEKTVEKVKTYHGHPAVLGWYTPEEPDGEGRPMDEYLDFYYAIRAIDTKDPVITVMNNHREPGWDYGFGVDVLMPETYPIPESSIILVSKHISDRKPWMDVHPDKGLWVTLEANHTATGRIATPAENTAQAYLAIIYGAKGLTWWNFDAADQENQLSLMTSFPDLWASFKELSKEIFTLKNAILKGTKSTAVSIPNNPPAFNTGVHALQLKYGNKVYVLAVHAPDLNYDPNSTLPFSLNYNPTDYSFDGVLFEGRTLTPDKPGAIKDTLRPLDRHVYAFTSTRETSNESNQGPDVFIMRNGLIKPQSRMSLEVTPRSSGTLKIQVFNRFGSLIRTLADRTVSAGAAETVEWDGFNEEGKVVASGLYLIRCELGSDEATKKVVVIR